MKQFILIPACLIFFVSRALAQTIGPFILNNTGKTATVSQVVFEFSLGEMATTTIGNSPVLTQGFLQPLILALNAPLPVTGLNLQAKRFSNQQVELRWTTIQESNNKGFTIERKKETEPGFTALAFIPSRAAGGNSSVPLSYQHPDTNNFVGRTWYRLRQEDFNGQTSYSDIRMVDGQPVKTILLKAWPIPAPKEFSVSITGNENDNLLIFTANGRLVKTLAVTDGAVLKINGLIPGTYLLRLQQQPDLVQKIIVQ